MSSRTSHALRALALFTRSQKPLVCEMSADLLVTKKK